MFLRRALALACASFFFFQGFGQKEKAAKWDVNNPGGPFKDVAFTTNEGTWINVDVSPDGKEIVFDLLGDIYGACHRW